MATSEILVNERGDAEACSGPDAVEVYRLALLLQGLKVEATGMRMSAKVPKATTICRRQYGLKGNREKMIQQVEKLLEAAKAKVTYVQR